MKKGISICLMAEDEERFIKKCIDSIYDVADEIVVLMDCHSTDKTKEIAKSYDKVKVYINHYSGDFHFANSRNASLRKASHYWTFVFDADEELISDAKECREFIMNAPEFSIIKAECLQIAGTSVYTRLDQPRVFPTRKGFKYEGHVHNQPIIENRDLKIIDSSPIRIKHNGFADDVKREKRIERTRKNVEITRAKIDSGNGDIKDYYNMVKMLQYIGNVEEAVVVGLDGLKSEYLNLTNNEKTNHERFLLSLVKAMMLTNQWDKVEEILHLHILVAGETVDGMFLMFTYWYRKGYMIGSYVYGLKFFELWDTEKNNPMGMQQYLMYEPIVREKLKFLSHAIERKMEL